MLDSQSAPLEIARKILKPETVRNMQIEGYSKAAYLILDRWALNQPDDLRQLEAMGPMELMLHVSRQASIEHQTLISDSAWKMSQQGMSDWEILEQHGIHTQLIISA